ncbi:phosphoribosyltransferase [Amycolatopsis sp. NPDC059657]|uniref:phosphoribosyltransferase n=1 Tax=Amycolatopsis sp. NPDC059657 TaxID=3346899 RepID=UPI00366B6700
MRYRDRRDAGEQLAARLRYLRGHHPLVLGMPRGGVLVAGEIADTLAAPLDVLLTREIHAPSHPEIVVGAVGESGVVVTEHRVVRDLGLSGDEFTEAANRERAELARQAAVYHRVRHPHPVGGQVVVLVDDGVTTGSPARAAIRVLRARGVGHLVFAVPVGPLGVLDDLARSVDRLVCPRPLRWMHAVKNSYQDFRRIGDEEVLTLLGAEHPGSIAAPSH